MAECACHHEMNICICGADWEGDELMTETATETEDSMQEELANFKPEPLTHERMQELHDQRESLDQMARDGQFGFQVLMMHPEGHVQMVSDLNNLVQFWLDHQEVISVH